MKKLFSMIAICLALVLAIPAVPVNAAGISRSNIYVRTRTSIGTPWPDYAVNQNFMLNSVWLEDSFVSAVNECLDNFDYSLFSNYDYYWLSAYSDNYTLFSLQMILFNSSQDPLIYGLNVSYNQQTAQTSARSSSLVPVCDDPHILVCSCQFNSSGMVSSQWISDPLVLTSSFGSGGLYYNSQTVGCALLDTNCGKYWWSVNVDALWANNDHQGYSNKFDWCLNNQDRVTNYWDNFPGYNSQGSLVDDPSSPSVEYESNSNHMYFKDCEIGFCYPKSSPAPVSFGGAYFYIKYQVDDWIVNHISDYSLVFYADAEVGSDVTNTIRYEIALDPDGCITIPFSRIWSTPLTSKGFSVLVTDREIEDNFYKAYLYSLSPSGFVEFGNKAAASNQNSISGALSALTSGGIQSFLYYINGDSIDLYSALSEVATSIAVKYNPYLITAFTLLTDGTDNSGLFEMEFDLVAGTEDVTDTGGLVNPDPFIPVDVPDYTPPAPSPGNSTTPGYNIVPSGFWQGTMNAVIGYDPGYRDLKSDVDRDPNGNFSQYLDPMHNDDVGSWFMSFVDEMPTEMKSILIAGVGVGVLFGLYRFIRRG